MSEAEPTEYERGYADAVREIALHQLGPSKVSRAGKTISTVGLIIMLEQAHGHLISAGRKWAAHQDGRPE